MNKLVKGSIAGAAGIALLLGGAGTLALWNATADIDGVTVTSGSLTLAETATSPDWTGPTTMVPGDVATYTTELTITVVGDTLKSTLSLDEGSLSGGAELPADLAVSFVATHASLTAGTVAGTYEVPAGPGTYVVPVVVTVTFDSNSDNSTQGESVTLTGAEFVLNQHL
jgi:alternate signal-mediated exported protein